MSDNDKYKKLREWLERHTTDTLKIHINESFKEFVFIGNKDLMQQEAWKFVEEEAKAREYFLTWFLNMERTNYYKDVETKSDLDRFVIEYAATRIAKEILKERENKERNKSFEEREEKREKTFMFDAELICDIHETVNIEISKNIIKRWVLIESKHEHSIIEIYTISDEYYNVLPYSVFCSYKKMNYCGPAIAVLKKARFCHLLEFLEEECKDAKNRYTYNNATFYMKNK